MNHGDQHPIATQDPIEALRIMRAAIFAQIECKQDELQSLRKQMQVVDHVVGLLSPAPDNPKPKPPPDAKWHEEVQAAVVENVGKRGGARIMAETLNAKGILTLQGKRWTTTNAARYVRHHEQGGDQ